MKKLTLAVSLAALTVGSAAYAHNHMGMKGDITRAQAQEKAAAMFASMDVNSDGLANDADRDARLAQHFDRMDSDKNGAISREEFTAGHAAMHGMGGGDRKGHHMGHRDGMKMGGHHGRMGGQRGHMMKMADKNGDGAISAAEFTEAHLAMFDKADANGDGTVTAAERKAAMEKMRETMKPSASAE